MCFIILMTSVRWYLWHLIMFWFLFEIFRIYNVFWGFWKQERCVYVMRIWLIISVLVVIYLMILWLFDEVLDFSWFERVFWCNYSDFFVLESDDFTRKIRELSKSVSKWILCFGRAILMKSLWIEQICAFWRTDVFFRM